jgi:hypothetical protein
MKVMTAFAFTVLSLTFGANAFAQTASHGLTRAEVRAQLIEAEADGLVPAPREDYPPSALTIARNREVYAIQHGTDKPVLTQTAHSSATGMPTAASE